VVRRGGAGEVTAALSALGAALHRVEPDFEDLFLSRIEEAS
jgi:hypothetical protein